jgi:hypothetical protein
MCVGLTSHVVVVVANVDNALQLALSMQPSASSRE